MAKRKTAKPANSQVIPTVRAFEIRIRVEGSRLELQYINNPSVFESLGAIKTAEALVEATLMEGRGK